MALGQTFINPSGDGFYITSVDIFFEEKDTALPVTLGIVNTYGEKPSNKILPFSTVTKNASDITVSTDGSTATTFTFESPVFLAGSETYCIGLETCSKTKK